MSYKEEGNEVITSTEVVRVMVDSLEGDGSTTHMGDVTPIDAVLWILDALDAAGFEVVKRADKEGE